MINKIIKERRRSMNADPTRHSNKSQWQGAQENPKHKQGRAQGRVQTGKRPPNTNQSETDKVPKENNKMIEQEGHDGPEVAHLCIGPRSGDSLNPRAFI
jgi:hypothetical protein